MLDALATALQPDTVLVGMTAAANETGVLQGVAEPLPPSAVSEELPTTAMQPRPVATCPWIRQVGAWISSP